MTSMPEYNTLDYLRGDKELQKEYLSELLNDYVENNDATAFLAALKPLIELNGSITDFANESGINRTYFYKLFRRQIKPEFPTIILIVKKLGFDINITLKTAN